MQFQYFKPHCDIQKLVSSYYQVTVQDAVADKMRAEIANIRFVLRGVVSSDINGVMEGFGAQSALLSGPTHRSSNVAFARDTKVFGAAITPLGWAQLFDVDADTLADRIVPLEEFVPGTSASQFRQLLAAQNGQDCVAACNKLFASMVSADKRVDEIFLEQVTAWITSPEPNELVDLLVQMQLSHRQIERLCKKYFGCAPKLLHRKFRALHSANRLTWQELDDWKDIAMTAYADQSHFIREFKQFNGRTPSEFIKGTHILVRTTLRERLQIVHGSPFSLIG